MRRISFPLAEILKRLATDFLVFCMDGVGQDRVRAGAWQGEILSAGNAPPEPRKPGLAGAFFRGEKQVAPKCGNVVDKAPALMTFSPFFVWLPSSMVEQLTLNQLVRGSSPRGATTFRFLPVTLVRLRSNASPA